MSILGDDKRHFHESESFESQAEPDTDTVQEWEAEFDENIGKNEKHKIIRKKLEEIMEQKKLRHEVDDYDEEVFKEFNWKVN